MKVAIAVIDANVVVSGLLTADPTAPTARILDAMMAGRLEFLVSLDLLAEYRTVLARPRIVARHGLSLHEIDRILNEIALAAIVREPDPDAPPAPDPGDDHLWGLLAAVPGAVLVTGDALLHQRPPDEHSVISPRAFVDAWPSGPGPWSARPRVGS